MIKYAEDDGSMNPLVRFTPVKVLRVSEFWTDWLITNFGDRHLSDRAVISVEIGGQSGRCLMEAAPDGVVELHLNFWVEGYESVPKVVKTEVRWNGAGSSEVTAVLLIAEMYHPNPVEEPDVVRYVGVLEGADGGFDLHFPCESECSVHRVGDIIRCHGRINCTDDAGAVGCKGTRPRWPR